MEEGRAADSVMYKKVARSLLGPQLVRTGGRLFHISTLPEDPEHFLNTEIYTSCEESGSLFIRDIYSNTCLSDADIKAQMKLCGGEKTPEWRREFLCIKERSSEQIIVPEFSAERHVREIIKPEKAIWLLAGDYGGSRDHFHAVLYTWDYRREKMIILSEVHHKSGTSNGVIIPSLRELETKVTTHYPGEKHPIPGVKRRWLDVPGQTMVDLCNDHQFPVTLPAKDDADAALNALRLAFDADRIEIDPSCVMTISALNACLWNEKRTDYKRTEKHGHADAIDAVVYAWRHLDKQNTYPFVKQPNEWIDPDTLPTAALEAFSRKIRQHDRRKR
jgi:hypothetical protein